MATGDSLLHHGTPEIEHFYETTFRVLLLPWYFMSCAHQWRTPPYQKIGQEIRCPRRLTQIPVNGVPLLISSHRGLSDHGYEPHAPRSKLHTVGVRLQRSQLNMVEIFWPRKDVKVAEKHGSEGFFWLFIGLWKIDLVICIRWHLDYTISNIT